MRNRNKNYYGILEIEPTNDFELIEKALKKFHPDNEGMTAEKFKEIERITVLFKDDNFRNAYFRKVNKNAFQSAPEGVYNRSRNITKFLRPPVNVKLEITDKLGPIDISIEISGVKHTHKLNSRWGYINNIKTFINEKLNTCTLAQRKRDFCLSFNVNLSNLQDVCTNRLLNFTNISFFLDNQIYNKMRPYQICQIL